MATSENVVSIQNKVAKNGNSTTAKKAAVSTKQSEVEKLKVALKQAEQAAALAGKEASEAKKKTENVQKQLADVRPINVADAIVKIYEAKEVVARLEFLRDTKKSLAAFSLGRSELKDEIKITDGAGHSFQTTNTNTIQTVLETLKQELDTKIQSTEQELMQMA